MNRLLSLFIWICLDLSSDSYFICSNILKLLNVFFPSSLVTKFRINYTRLHFLYRGKFFGCMAVYLNYVNRNRIVEAPFWCLTCKNSKKFSYWSCDDWKNWFEAFKIPSTNSLRTLQQLFLPSTDFPVFLL